MKRVTNCKIIDSLKIIRNGGLLKVKRRNCLSVDVAEDI